MEKLLSRIMSLSATGTAQKHVNYIMEELGEVVRILNGKDHDESIDMEAVDVIISALALFFVNPANQIKEFQDAMDKKISKWEKQVREK